MLWEVEDNCLQQRVPKAKVQAIAKLIHVSI